MTASASAVGVPHTAADGCSDSARVSEDAPSTRTPATSVARCMTFERWRTKGASGTFIDEQCGASASATERTAYSCSSRSFDERASDAASARSCSSSPVRRIVPASTREVTRPFSRRTRSSGVAPTSPSTAKTQVVSYCSARRCSSQRTSRSEDADTSRSRARTTLSREPAVIRETASATAPAHCAGRQRPVGEGDVDRCGGRLAHPHLGSPGHGRHRGSGLDAHGRQPGDTAAHADDDLGNDERGAGLRPGGVGHRPEGDRSGPRPVDLVADHGGADEPGPPRLELGHPARAGRRQRGGAAPADEALAAADPRHDVARPTGRHEREERGTQLRREGHGAGHERGCGRPDRVGRPVTRGQRGHHAGGYDPHPCGPDTTSVGGWPP